MVTVPATLNFLNQRQFRGSDSNSIDGSTLSQSDLAQHFAKIPSASHQVYTKVNCIVFL